MEGFNKTIKKARKLEQKKDDIGTWSANVKTLQVIYHSAYLSFWILDFNFVQGLMWNQWHLDIFQKKEKKKAEQESFLLRFRDRRRRKREKEKTISEDR